MKAIVLTRGRIATVDDEDFDRCNQFKWYARKQRHTYYGARSLCLADGQRAVQYLHQFILGLKGVDHRDGDGLENRRKNLRPATRQQNLQGRQRKALGATSRFRGVYWNRQGQKWMAQIGHNHEVFFLGIFAVEEDAARAYDVAAQKLFGGFASPNFSI